MKSATQNINLQCLCVACEQNSITYKVLDEYGNLIEVILDQKSWLFLNWTTPLNSQSVARLCRDKGNFIRIFKDVIRLPDTMGFLDPDVQENYSHFIKFTTYESIASSVESQIDYPLIVKPNHGTNGRLIRLVRSQSELINALKNIYQRNQNNYDYLALVQAFLDIEHEYRMIYLNGNLSLCYEKKSEKTASDENLSPLHQTGGKAELVNDAELLQQLDMFCKPLFKKLMISFCGLDVVRTRDNKLYLLEANSAPGFKYAVRDLGLNPVVNLYKDLLNCLSEFSSAR